MKNAADAIYTLSIQYLYDREQAQAALRGNKADGIILLGTEMAAEDYQPFEQCPVPLWFWTPTLRRYRPTMC